MAETYDIYYAGGLQEGFEEATVRANLGKLFKASDAALDKLFSGTAQPVKRGVDKAAAIKYKQAMTKAGAVAVIRKAAGAQTQAAAATPAPAPEPSAEQPQSMADRLAALTSSGGTTAATMTLAPAGSEILNPEERPPEAPPEIDLSGLSLVPGPEQQPATLQVMDEREVDREPTPLPEPVLESEPDLSHLSMGEVGDDIPTLADEAAALEPDTSHLSVGEVGEDIPTLAVQAQMLDPDISAISLAPEGSNVLEEQFRRHDDATPPSTDHIQLEAAGAE